MAIQFARAEYVSRSQGKNACCKSAYNARARITDQKSDVTYTFERLKDNTYHKVLLPSYVQSKFQDIKILSNKVEAAERRKDSQLFKEYVLALPDNIGVQQEDRIELVHRFINGQGFIDHGLGVQVDIHAPHDGDKNWHAHLLVTTRAFTKDGEGFEHKKTTALDPLVRGANHYVVDNKANYGDQWKEIQNNYFQEKGWSLRVDNISPYPEQHLGPIRMRGYVAEAKAYHQALRSQEAFTSGHDVVLHVSKYQAIFNEEDLRRAVKNVVDAKQRDALVKEALRDKGLLSLSGLEGFYTTKQVRIEEERCYRLAARLSNSRHKVSGDIGTGIDSIRDQNLITSHQSTALTSLMSTSSGLHVLQGRAGTGKSHVLGWYQALSEEYYDRQVIGLAPTHKAVQELHSQGFDEAYTLKGFLFNHKQGKADIEDHATLVVDEAGMVDTASLTELFKVAIKHDCKVLLAGDDRQLQSIERGGMLSLLSERFESAELSDIKRQKNDWGRKVSTCFSQGDVLGGLGVLDKQNKVHFKNTEEEALQHVLDKRSGSDYKTDVKLMLAISNAHVDALNKGARDILKAKGKLSGPELEITNKHGTFNYSSGDRVVITESNKHVGLKNGEFGTLHLQQGAEYPEGTSLTIQLDNGTQKVIDPAKTCFKHGYATTVYKAQGASIKDVHVYHSGFSTRENSYVKMSRHVEDLNVYCNIDRTLNLESLAKQMMGSLEYGSSLWYKTEAESEQSTYKQVRSFFKSMLDPYHQNKEYYNYESDSVAENKVRQVLDKEHMGKESSKWDQQLEQVRHDLKFCAERLSKHLMGEPNLTLSTNQTLRYGDKGSLAIEIAGPKAGVWHDFTEGKGGDMLSFISSTQNIDFKDALSFAKGFIGNRNLDITPTPEQHKPEDKQPIKADEEFIEQVKANNKYAISSIQHFNKDTDIEPILARASHIKDRSEQFAFFKKEIAIAFSTHVDHKLAEFAAERPKMSEKDLMVSLEQEQQYLHKTRQVHKSFYEQLNDIGRNDLAVRMHKAHPDNKLLDHFKQDLQLIDKEGKAGSKEDLLNQATTTALHVVRHGSEECCVRIIKDQYHRHTYHFSSKEQHRYDKFNQIIHKLSGNKDYKPYFEQSDLLKNAVNIERDMHRRLDAQNQEIEQQNRSFQMER